MSKTREQFVETIKKYMPSGFLHEAINIISTNLYKMLYSIVGMFKREYESEEYIKKELNPVTTYDLISDWEKQFGIPDQCFKTQNISVINRRSQVITKMTANVQTNKDFVDLAAKLGVIVTLTPKAETTSTLPLDMPYTVSGIADFFTVIVDIQGWDPNDTLPLLLPYVLGGIPYQSVVQCLFDRLKPSHVKFEYI